jgi:hypothetical protein
MHARECDTHTRHFGFVTGVLTDFCASLTFLATLFVLLFVSCAIVLRSFFIRRRYRRQLEQQIALGLLPPDALHPRTDFGEKPLLWDVYVGAEDEKPLLEYDGWDEVLVSVAPIALSLSLFFVLQ